MSNGSVQEIQYLSESCKFGGLKNFLTEVGAELEGLIFVRYNGGSNLTLNVFERNGVELLVGNTYKGSEDYSASHEKCCDGKFILV